MKRRSKNSILRSIRRFGKKYGLTDCFSISAATGLVKFIPPEAFETSDPQFKVLCKDGKLYLGLSMLAFNRYGIDVSMYDRESCITIAIHHKVCENDGKYTDVLETANRVTELLVKYEEDTKRSDS